MPSAEVNKPMESLSEIVSKGAVEAEVKGVGPVAGKKIADKTVANVSADPVAINTLNQERWWQSGVGWFGTGGILWSIGIIFEQVGQHGFDYTHYNAGQMVAASGAVIGFLGVLYRRYVPGLKPLLWRLTHKETPQ